MYVLALIVFYCVLIIAASLLGGWLPVVMRLTHTRMQLMMSGVGGLMLGVGILHMLPHGISECGNSIDWAMGSLLLGLLTTFFLMRLFHFHEHVPVEEEYPGIAADDHQHGGHLHCEHEHNHSGHHGHAHAGSEGKMRWLGVFLGLSLHTLLDGVALAAGISAVSHHQPQTISLLGFGVFMGIFLHKPLDALSITFIMRQSDWPISLINIVNLGYALMCPLGVILFYAGYNGLEDSKQFMVGMALCFSAGVFLCISLADILPEVQFHSHDKAKLSLVMLLGVLAAYLIGFTEPGGLHNHSHGPTTPSAETTSPPTSAPKPTGT